MNILDHILPARRRLARIRKMQEALDPELALDIRLYNGRDNGIFVEDDIINATWRLVRVDGVLRRTPWEGRKK